MTLSTEKLSQLKKLDIEALKEIKGGYITHTFGANGEYRMPNGKVLPRSIFKKLKELELIEAIEGETLFEETSPQRYQINKEKSIF